METVNTGPKPPETDPDRDYEIRVLVVMRGYGKAQHQVQTVQTMLKALHTAFHDKGIRAFIAEEYGPIAPDAFFEGEEIVRDDRNADAPEKAEATQEVDRPEPTVDPHHEERPSVGPDELSERSGDTGRHGTLFPGMGRTEGEIAREQRMLNNESA